MGSLQITTKDERTKELLIDLLHTMRGVEVKEIKKSTQSTLNPRESFQQLCGIWKDRDINLCDVRAEAWRRGIK